MGRPSGGPCLQIETAVNYSGGFRYSLSAISGDPVIVVSAGYLLTNTILKGPGNIPPTL